MVNPSKLKLVLLGNCPSSILAPSFCLCKMRQGFRQWINEGSHANRLPSRSLLSVDYFSTARTGQVSVEHKFLFSRIPPVMSPCEQLGLLPMPRAFSAGQDSSIFHDRRDFNFYYSMQMKLWFIVTFPSFGLAAPNLSVDLEVRRFGLVFIVKLCNNGLIGGWL